MRAAKKSSWIPLKSGRAFLISSSTLSYSKTQKIKAADTPTVSDFAALSGFQSKMALTFKFQRFKKTLGSRILFVCFFYADRVIVLFSGQHNQHAVRFRFA